MSKRRKTSILDLENELSTSKAKKSLRRKTKQIESNLETPVQTFQGEKLVPMFKKQRKMQNERHEGKFGETATICTEQVQHADRKGLDTTGNAAQNTVASLKSPEQMDLLGIKMEDTGKQEILHETLDFKMQDQDRISSLNYDDASSGVVDAHQIGTEPDLQAGICETEMPKKQISDFLNRPDKEDVDSPEKRKIPLKSLKCPFLEEMNVSKLEESRITDHTKSKQNQEDCPRSLDIGMKQKKVSQNIIQSAHIREPNSTKNGSRNGIVLAECMLLQPQEKNSIPQLPLVTHLSVSILGEPSKYPHTCSVARQESTDTKEPSQSHPYSNGKTEGQNGMYSNAEAKEQHNLWTTEKVAEQNGTGRVPVQISLCKKETNVAEQNSVKSQDTAWEVLPDTQSGCIYLGKEADLPEPKCETKCEIRNNLLLPQLDGDIQPVNRRVPVEDIVYKLEWERDKKEIAMKTNLAKNTGAFPDPKVPVLLAQQQQKENCCEKLVLNIKPELDKVDLRPSEITKALSNMSITQQILTKIPKPERKTTVTENSLSTPDVHLDGKQEIVNCVENKNQSGLSSVDILPIQVWVGDPSREHKADLDTQKTLFASDTFSKMTAPSNLDAEAQTHSPCSDPLSLDLEFLPDSQLHDIFERHQCEFSSHEIKFLDSPHSHSMRKSDHCAAKKQNGSKSVTSVVPVTHQKNARNVVMEKNSDPSKQQDTTEVVCGLTKELSNLNRLIMNTHRDLDSFKRQKFRRNKQSGKLLFHSMNNMTGTLSTLKKRREL